MQLLSFFTLLVVSTTLVAGQCPWQTAGLQNWDNGATWGGAVPAAGADVVISGGMKVLLNVQPPQLNSISIENDGQLVWGDVDGIEIVTKFIYIGTNGRLDIGSPTCPFSKKAIVTLVGLESDPIQKLSFGSKFIGVGSGGTLEMHGQLRAPSWTKLAATASSNSYTANNGGRGMTLAVFDGATGEFKSTSGYDTYGNVTYTNEMVDYINAIPNGDVVVVVARDSAERFLAPAFPALESLGSALARNISHRDSWALIGVKGSAVGTAAEAYSPRYSGPAITTKTFGTGQTSFTIEARSAGNDDGNFILINKVGNPTPIVTLITPVQWIPGDKIVLASTDYNMDQAEEATIIPCPECAPNQVKISAPLQYMHFGEIVDGVDERGEVALLTRNILVRGQMEPACYAPQFCQYFNYDTFGGHLKVTQNFASVHIDSVELYHMGQQILGSYPLHFHMTGNVDSVGGYNPRTYVKNNAIHKSFSRCVTIHGTHGLLVEGNVGYDHLGHCYFLEDGIETRNDFITNLGLVTRPGTLLPTDRSNAMCTGMVPTDFNGNPTSVAECSALTTFWISHPANNMVNNSAAGCANTGIWFIFPSKPHGESAALGIDVFPQFTPLGLFKGNVAHSNGNDGLHFDDGIKITQPSAANPAQYLSKMGMRYKPRENPAAASPRVPAVLEDLTCYKNRNRGVWVRGGDFRFFNFRSADNAIGMTLASEGTYPNDPGSSQTLSGGIFVGESHNVGSNDGGPYDQNQQRSLPKYGNFPVRGWEFYDGPVAVDNASFRKFYPTSLRNASAIGFLLNNNWQVSPHNNASFLDFDDSLRVYMDAALNPDQPYFGSLDGDLNAVFKDLDGTTTGIPGSSVVPLTPFFNTYTCIERPEWAAQVCRDPFVQIYVTNQDKANTNFDLNTGEQKMLWVRDERSDFTHVMQGIPQTPPGQYQPLLIVDKSYTLHFTYPTPPRLRYTLVNFNEGQTLRLGVCYPQSTSFVVTRTVGGDVTELTEVDSIEELDYNSTGEVFFWDEEVGLLFVKLMANHGRDGDNYCGMEGCERVDVTATGPDVGTVIGNCIDAAYPKYSVDEYIPPTSLSSVTDMTEYDEKESAAVTVPAALALAVASLFATLV